LFSLGIVGIVRGTVGGFEERRKVERYKLALPVQLKNGIGITCDSVSGIVFEIESVHSIGDTIRLSLHFISNTRRSSAKLAWYEWSRAMINSALPWSRMFFVENERVLNADGK
jgi:hypothetical protein